MSSKMCNYCLADKPMRFYPLKYSSPDNKGDTCFSCIKAQREFSEARHKVQQIEKTKLFVIRR